MKLRTTLAYAASGFVVEVVISPSRLLASTAARPLSLLKRRLSEGFHGNAHGAVWAWNLRQISKSDHLQMLLRAVQRAAQGKLFSLLCLSACQLAILLPPTAHIWPEQNIQDDVCPRMSLYSQVSSGLPRGQ